jgi:hypothetical protein
MVDGKHGLLKTQEQSTTILAHLVLILHLISDECMPQFYAFPVLSTHDNITLYVILGPGTQEEAAMTYDQAAV